MLRKTLICAALVSGVLLIPQLATAGVASLFTYNPNQTNQVKFNNYEVILQEDAGGSLSLPGGSYTLVTDPTTIDVASHTYVAVQILRATTIQWRDSSNGSSIYNQTGAIPGGGDLGPFPVAGVGEITAYAAQELTSFTIDGLGNVNVAFGAAATDPFGILTSAGLITKVFLDDTTNDGTLFSSDGGGAVGLAAQLTNDVGNATDGALFAEFGIGLAADGGVAGDNTSLTSSGAVDSQLALGGLNVFHADPSLTTGLTFMGVDNTANAGLNPVSISLRANITLGGTPWTFTSEDPWKFRLNPEPGSLAALAGMAVVGLAGRLIRRRRSNAA